MDIPQLYMNIHDLIPTEGEWVHEVPYAQLADKSEDGHWKYTDWLNDIRKNGVMYQAKVHPSKHIGDGNFRRHCLKLLFEQKLMNNWKYAFMPIDWQYFFGLQRIGNILNIRSDIWQYLSTGSSLHGIPTPPSMYAKRKAQKLSNVFPIIDESDLGHGSHAYGRVNNLTHLTTSLFDPWADK